MNGRLFYPYLSILLFLVGLSTRTFGQTVTITAVNNTSDICPGSSIAVSYTSSGTFAASNTFKVELSDIAGNFPANPITVGTSTSATSGTINAIIPSATVSGSNYFIRLVSTNPVKTSLTTRITISRPTVPTAPSSYTYCKGENASPLSATPMAGGVLKWYTSGGALLPNAPTPNTSAPVTTSYFVSQVVGGCESLTATVTVIVKDAPNAPSVSTPLTYCLGQPASSLSATPAMGATLNWYSAAMGGTASNISPVPSTTATGSTTYYVSQSIGGSSCESPRVALTVTVNGIPAAPGVLNPTYCEGVTANQLSATPSAGGALKWYGTNQTGGTASGTSPTPSTTPPGAANYYVSQAINGCESTRATITVTIKDAPNAPGTAPLTYCAGQPASTLTATPASASATLNWYGTSQTGGTASGTAPAPQTNTPGTVNYYVSQTQSGCESPRAVLAVTTKTTPGSPGVTSFIACQNKTGYALTATQTTGASLNWYGTAATGGTATTTPPTLSTTSLGSTTYYVSQSLNGCESARASITVMVNAVPAIPTFTAPGAYCEGTSAGTLNATGNGLRWYGTSQTGGSASNSAPSPNTSASFIGTTNYYVTQTVSGCESDRVGIPVQVKDTPDAPGTSNVEFCQGTGAPTLTAMLVPNATSNWYGTSASGGTASSTAPTPTNTTVGTTVYYVSQTLSGCEGPRASLNVRVKAVPGAPGTNSISFCNNGPSQALTANGQNLTWYDGSDNPIGNAPNPGTGSVGDQTYKVSQSSSEGCESAKATLTVTIIPLPGTPNVSDISYCQSQQDQPGQTVSALNANGLNLRWYANNNFIGGAPTPSIVQAGTQVYQVSQTVNGCEGSRADIRVFVNTSAAPTTPKSLVTYCVNDNATPLVASGDNGGQLRWIDPYNRTTNDAPTPSTINTNVTPGGDAFYVYQISANGCYSPRTTIRVVVTSPPTLALAAPVASVNLGQRAPLQLKFTSVGPYSYTLTGGYTGTSRTSDTTISVLPRANNTIYQIIGVSNGCGVGLPGNPATAQIIVRVPTVSTGSLSSTTLCTGTSLSAPFTTTGEFNSGNTFRLDLVNAADTTQKYSFPATANASPITGTLPNTIPGGQYYVRVKADNPEIAIIGSISPTPLTVRSVAGATLTGTQTIYEGIPANLTLTFAGDGPWTATYADSLRTYSVTATTNPYATEVRPTRTTTYQLVSVTNSCGSGPVSGTATITVSSLLGIDDNPLDPLVKTYPIPTTTTLRIELNLPLIREPATLSLTDQTGRSILQRTTRSQQNELDLTAQPGGLYFLRIQVGDKQTVRKVIKQ